MKVKKYMLCIPLFFLTSGCGAMICSKKDKWVKKLIVKNNGFLLVSSQKTASCKNKEEIKRTIKESLPISPCERITMIKYPVRRYITDRGYEEWANVPEKEWSKIKDIKHTLSKQADYHYEDCSYSIFGRFYMFLAILHFI